MLSLFPVRCPTCGTQDVKLHTHYQVKGGQSRALYWCPFCKQHFSETKHTFLEGLRTPLSRISTILNALNDGMGINAACRTFHVSKESISRWVGRLGNLKEHLLLYALCHQFLEHFVEGDELYNLVEDPRECRYVIQEYLEVARRLAGAFGKIYRRRAVTAGSGIQGRYELASSGLA